MSIWHAYVQRDGKVPEWPYPVNYGQVNEIVSDVLVIGGGVAGVRAAIAARQMGATVALAEVGHAKRSGAGGAGVDHWHGAVTNPCSKVTPEEYTQGCYDSMYGYTGGHVRYIITKESWDTLLECEKWGVQIRDVKDEFKGAEFRDEATKLMFAYDYANKHILRIWGYNIKPAIFNEAERLGVKVHNRITTTSLLTERGVQGARVVGATGVNNRTGEFYVFRAKATIIATGGAGRLYLFAPELTAAAAMSDLNSAGVGHAIGWKAGAEFVCMEKSAHHRLSGYGYAPYSMGNASNTYHGAPIIDANGKEVPWVDGCDKPLQTIEERFLPGAGQKFQLGIGIGISNYLPQYRQSDPVRDLADRIRKGEFVLPFYIDLTRFTEHERRAMFGLMVGNEGKTRIPIYDTFTRAGFDPDKDMLQAPVMNLEGYLNSCFWTAGVNTPPNIRAAGGSYLVDWDLKTSLEGLYAAASHTAYGGGCHGESHTTGRFAGKRAAEYARTAPPPEADKQQIEAEKARVYAAVRQPADGVGWKEINQAIARVMQDYCGKHKNEHTLTLGLRLLQELKETELSSARAANPHELGRLMECYSLIEFGEAVMQASLARKASNSILDFHRLDYPQMDPPEWNKLLPIKQENGAAVVRDLPLDYFLQAPYAQTYEENYQAHAGLKKEASK
jgi:succinate dehydrogenase/fumarate reductase flavoprotein subunit